MLNKKETRSTNVDEVDVFNFSQEKAPIRVQLINNEPWFVAKDVCEVLDHSNHKMAIKALDEDEVSSVYLMDALGRKQETRIVNESGLYSLIFQSRKPEARKFRKWVTSEVLPSIRRKGYYGIRKNRVDYIDARDIPYDRVNLNGIEVKTVEIDGVRWYSVNDINKSMGSRTESSQSVKNLNARQNLAIKIWLYGVTNPGWFTTELGIRLMRSGSIKAAASRLIIDFEKRR